MADLSQAHLCEIFNYDPATGALTWRARPLSHFLNERDMRIANTKCANKQAATMNGNGYVRLHIRYRGEKLSLYAHRVIWKMIYGAWPIGVIDHINGNRRDNRLVNLRDTTIRDNALNSSIRSTNRTGVTGVYADGSKWVVRITIHGKSLYLGRFGSLGEAVKMRKKAEKKFRYHPNHGRAKVA